MNNHDDMPVDGLDELYSDRQPPSSLEDEVVDRWRAERRRPRPYSPALRQLVRIAAGLAVTGAVRNLADGRVELVAEGEAAEINELLRQVRDHFPTNIDDCETTTSTPTGAYSSFAVRY